MKKRILFVDDEAMLLEMYRLVFEQEKDEWDLDFASSAREALTKMESAPFDVVISDMRMPGMTGADLFVEVMRLYPKTSRLIMSGYTDQEQVAKCLGATHQFIAKPFDIKVLKATIWRVCSLDSWMLDEKLRGVVAQLYSVPSLPSLYFKIMTALESPAASLEEVGEIIGRDPAMTAKMLQLVNSAFFGISRKISNPGEAVQFLGVGRVRSLVLSLHIFTSFDQGSLRNFSLDRIWSHSIATGVVAQKIARMQKADRTTQDEAYVSGMLHDIGKVMLASSLGEQYEHALAISEERRIRLVEAEREVFGVTHAEVGAYLLGLWGLPLSIVEAVALHHLPATTVVKTFSPLTAVHVASVLENELCELHCSLPPSVVDEDYLAELGLDDRLEEWKDAGQEVLAEAMAS